MRPCRAPGGPVPGPAPGAARGWQGRGAGPAAASERHPFSAARRAARQPSPEPAARTAPLLPHRHHPERASRAPAAAQRDHGRRLACSHSWPGNRGHPGERGVAQPKPAPRDYSKGCVRHQGVVSHHEGPKHRVSPMNPIQCLSTGTDFGITRPSVRQVGTYISQSRLLSSTASFGQQRSLPSCIEIVLPIGLYLLQPSLCIYLPAPPTPHQASDCSWLMSSSHHERHAWCKSALLAAPSSARSSHCSVKPYCWIAGSNCRGWHLGTGLHSSPPQCPVRPTHPTPK